MVWLNLIQPLVWLVNQPASACSVQVARLMSEGIAGMDEQSRRDASSISETAIDFTEAIVCKNDNCWPWITWLTDR